MKKDITFDMAVRAIIIIAACVVAYLLILRLSSVLIPFLVAWLIAYLLYPIVRFFQYRCRLRNRVLAIIVTLLCVLAVLTAAGLIIIPPMISEVRRLSEVVVNYITTNENARIMQRDIVNYINENIDLSNLSSSISLMDLSTIIEERVPQLFNFVTSSVNALVGFVCSLIALIYMFFILIDYEKMSAGVINIVPKDQRPFIRAILHDVEQGMNAYFRGQSLIALIVGVLFSVGFTIIGLPLAIPLGLFIGLLNLVPYLQTLGFIPTIILALVKAHDTGDNFWFILMSALIVFAVVQAIQDWYLVPKIMGNVTGLNAAVILLSLSIWGSLLGFVGLIIALPLTTLIVSYYKRFILNANTDLPAPLPHRPTI